MTATTSEMTVLLGDLPVGSLMLDHRGTIEFRWLSSYLNAYPRPVLGQHFLDDPGGVYRSHTRLPPWFSNLLPEGLLRELVARQAQVGPDQEYALLSFLGGDLPGHNPSCWGHGISVSRTAGGSPHFRDKISPRIVRGKSITTDNRVFARLHIRAHPA